MGNTEVTQTQWSAVMGTTPWIDKEQKGDNRPATFVSWNDAKAFCERLTAKEKNGAYRLPTEAEWEFACRAGTNTRFSFGEDAALLGRFAWISDNSRKVGEKYAHDVALKKPNAFGLFDMHGNVGEYCDGAFTTDPTKEERPRAAKEGPLRVVAGGSWDADLSHLASNGSAYAAANAAFYCRSDSRSWPIPTCEDNSTGFRVAWSPPANKKGMDNSDKKQPWCNRRQLAFRMAMAQPGRIPVLASTTPTDVAARDNGRGCSAVPASDPIRRRGSLSHGASPDQQLVTISAIVPSQPLTSPSGSSSSSIITVIRSTAAD